MADAPDMLAMSDDEFNNLSGPPVVEEAPVDPSGSAEGGDVSGAEAKTETVEAPTTVEDKPEAEAAPEKDVTDLPDDEIEKLRTPPAEKKEEAPAAEGADKEKGSEAAQTKEEPKPGETVTDPKSSGTEGQEKKEEAPVVIELSIDDKAKAFDQIMAPLKANGKTIELRDPAEAIQLMQMGANYTKKLQQLQPVRKIAMMLENNGLMDQDKLSFLIDIERGDPEAIKKLLKDKGINPLEIDTDVDPAYLGGSHTVSEEEVGFHTALDELSSNPEGAATLTEINTNWDQASKEVLWTSPEVMTTIHEHRQNGIYDIIKAEVDRQTTLGHVPANTPFLTAYKTVGDAMAAAATANAKANSIPAEEQTTTEKVETKAEPQILDTKVAAPKSKFSDSDRASAASPTRNSPKTAPGSLNFLAMGDEEFLNQMNNRL